LLYYSLNDKRLLLRLLVIYIVVESIVLGLSICLSVVRLSVATFLSTQ